MSSARRYRLVRMIGAGGMAQVFEAVRVGERDFERRVALKRILPQAVHDAAIRNMFLDEARIVSGLHHANIVQVFDYGTIDDSEFLVLELIDGMDAEQLARTVEGGVPVAVALHIIQQIAYALAYAHDAEDEHGRCLDIVHRDVTPQNILLSWSGDVKLSDFGIAMARGRQVETTVGVVKGKLAYLAPEQKAGQPATGRTDVYALGQTLHRLLEGQTASTESPDASLRGVEPDVRELLRAMLHPTPESRPDASETQIGVGDSVLVVERGALGSTRPAADPIPGMVAVSPAMERVASMVHKVAPSSVSVLIQGETGTGKEVVARAIHALSPRSEAPFEIVDCGSLPAALIASELFGHERGSFTGADRRRLGAFERADGGTVFLDEVGELPLALQPALLGVLQRSQFRRVGGESTQTVDVRVVAATHRDLRAGANDGSFRADLYYRLAVARILVPALRDRRDDITPLVEHFARELTGGPSPFSPAALSAFEAHPWGGNVRELRNVVEASLALGTLSLAPSVSAPSKDSGELPTYRDARAAAIEEFELRYLPRLIESCEGNASEAARRARMDRPYLLSLLRKHGLR